MHINSYRLSTDMDSRSHQWHLNFSVASDTMAIDYAMEIALANADIATSFHLFRLDPSECYLGELLTETRVTLKKEAP